MMNNKSISSLRSALRSVSLLWLGSLVSAGLAFLTQVILARKLTPFGYGAFSAALAIVTLLVPFADFGVQGFWLKAFGAEGWAAKRWLSASFRFVAVSTVMVLTLLVAWALWGPNDQLTRQMIYWLLPVTVGYLFIGLGSTKLQLEERYRVLAVWQIFPNLARLLLILILISASLQPILDLVGVVYSLVALMMTVAGFLQLQSMYGVSFALKGHQYKESLQAKENVKIIDIARESWPFCLGGVFHLIYFQSDIILLKYLVGNETAGIYNVAFTVMVAVYLLPSTIYQKFLLPKIHRWAYQDRARFLQVYRFGNGVMLLLGVITTALLLIMTPWIIPLFFGYAYFEAVDLLFILAFCAPLRFLASSVGATLVTQEHMNRKNVLMGLVALINILLNFFLIPIYAAKGAAAATLVSEFVLIALYLVAVRRYVFGRDALRGWTLRFNRNYF